MPITKKAKAEAIERDYRINKRPDISDETTITWAELGALQARIAELEKSAVVWHRYPEEKPTKKDLYVVYLSSRNLAREDLWDNDKQRWDHTPEDCQHLITHWAYLPAPPEEAK